MGSRVRCKTAPAGIEAFFPVFFAILPGCGPGSPPALQIRPSPGIDQRVGPQWDPNGQYTKNDGPTSACSVTGPK
jgi:hypothetical protein